MCQSNGQITVLYIGRDLSVIPNDVAETWFNHIIPQKITLKKLLNSNEIPATSFGYLSLSNTRYTLINDTVIMQCWLTQFFRTRYNYITKILQIHKELSMNNFWKQDFDI